MFGGSYFGQQYFGGSPLTKAAESSEHGFVPKGTGTYTLMTVKNSAGELLTATTSKAAPYAPLNAAEEAIIAKTWAFLVEKV